MDGGRRERQERGAGVGSRRTLVIKVLIQRFRAVWEKEVGSKGARLIQNSIRAS